MARLQIELEDDLKTRIKLQAVREDKTMSQLIAAAAELYLQQVKADKP